MQVESPPQRFSTSPERCSTHLEQSSDSLALPCPKKSNGVAVDDGVYTLTFKLYTVQSGGTAIWDEIQDNIEVSSGMYSTTLGTTDPLTVPFNPIYCLGITIGSTELTSSLIRP